MKVAIQLLMALIGSLGFGLVFNVHGRKLVFAALGGFLAWGVYLLVLAFGASDYAAAFTATMAVFFYAELMARILRAPVTVFSVVSTIPLIPGASLYRTMDALMQKDYAAFGSHGMYTLLFAAAMAAGVVASTAIVALLNGKTKAV